MSEPFDIRLAPRSYSQLSLYQKCGEAYRLEKVVRIPERQSVWQVGGSAFHGAVEQLNRDMHAGRPVAPTKVWCDHWAKHLAEAISVDPNVSGWRCAGRVTKDKPNRENVDWWAEAGLNMVIAYLAWTVANPHLQLVELPADGGPAVEFGLTPELGGVTVRMFPDALYVDTRTGDITCVDYKTGSREPVSYLQHGTYKAGVEKALGLPVKYGAYYMARKAELSEPRNLDQWSQKTVGHLFAQMDEGVKAGRFAPNIGDHCKWACSVSDWCVYTGGSQHADDPGVYA